MKNRNKIIASILRSAAIIMISGLNLFAQTDEKKLPSVGIKTMEGKAFDSKDISNNGKPILIAMWETTCKPCITQLDAIAENYEDWQKETGVKVVAISIDNSRTAPQVPVMVRGRDWKFEVYSDINQDFKRALGFSYCPFVILIDNAGNMAWQNNSYAPGDEDLVYEKIKKVAKGEKL